MELKKGVKLTGVSTELMFGILVADRIWKNHAKILVITEILPTERHRISSAHNTGRAADLRTHYFDNQEEKEEVAQELREAVGENYDVVLHPTHIHIEYDPK